MSTFSTFTLAYLDMSRSSARNVWRDLSDADGVSTTLAGMKSVRGTMLLPAQAASDANRPIAMSKRSMEDMVAG